MYSRYMKKAVFPISRRQSKNIPPTCLVTTGFFCGRRACRFLTCRFSLPFELAINHHSIGESLIVKPGIPRRGGRSGCWGPSGNPTKPPSSKPVQLQVGRYLGTYHDPTNQGRCHSQNSGYKHAVNKTRPPTFFSHPSLHWVSQIHSAFPKVISRRSLTGATNWNQVRLPQ